MDRIFRYLFVVILGVVGTILTASLLVPLNLNVSKLFISDQHSWKILYLCIFLQLTATLICMILWIKFGFFIFNKLMRGKSLNE